MFHCSAYFCAGVAFRDGSVSHEMPVAAFVRISGVTYGAGSSSCAIHPSYAAFWMHCLQRNASPSQMACLSHNGTWQPSLAHMVTAGGVFLDRAPVAPQRPQER